MKGSILMQQCNFICCSCWYGFCLQGGKSVFPVAFDTSSWHISSSYPWIITFLRGGVITGGLFCIYWELGIRGLLHDYLQMVRPMQRALINFLFFTCISLLYPQHALGSTWCFLIPLSLSQQFYTVGSGWQGHPVSFQSEPRSPPNTVSSSGVTTLSEAAQRPEEQQCQNGYRCILWVLQQLPKCPLPPGKGAAPTMGLLQSVLTILLVQTGGSLCWAFQPNTEHWI